MKKLAVMMLGLALIVGTTAPTAMAKDKKEKKKKTKKTKKTDSK